jgi:hypothetical protein
MREFDSVRETAGTGYVQAFFYGSAGQDLFEGAVDQSRLSGAGYEVVDDAFDRVRAYGDSGQDSAVLVDPGDGATVTNQANYNLLRGEGFDILAYNFGTAVVRTSPSPRPSWSSRASRSSRGTPRTAPWSVPGSRPSRA